MPSASADVEHRGERGSVTAEFAVALPAIVFVLAICLAAVMLVAQQVRLTDAAADAARALGRGESIEVAGSIAHRVAGESAISSSTDGEFVCVVLASEGRGVLAVVPIRAESCALGGGR